MPTSLIKSATPGAQIQENTAGTWVLEIPAGPAGRYRLAQLDDYTKLKRSLFPWQAGTSLELRARASNGQIPGTWGFGLWNDPFSMGILSKDRSRLPTLPNAAWFFFASPHNYLSLHDGLPAHGGMAATFCSPLWPPVLLALAAPGLPLVALPPAVRLLRRIGRSFIQQDAVQLALDPTDWHTYRLEWQASQVLFQVDGEMALKTVITPSGRLGLVIWIDNQYAALPPSGRLRYGTLPNFEAAWLEIADLKPLQFA